LTLSLKGLPVHKISSFTLSQLVFKQYYFSVVITVQTRSSMVSQKKPLEITAAGLITHQTPFLSLN